MPGLRNAGVYRSDTSFLACWGVSVFRMGEEEMREEVVGRRPGGTSVPSHRSMRRSVALIAALAVSAVTLATFGASAASAGVMDVTLDGPGKGTVTSAPAGIDCSNVPGSTQTACIHDFGFVIATGTLTATPGEGWAFLSWSGSGGGTCSGSTNPCTTGLLFQNHSVTATFVPAPDLPTVVTGAPSEVEFPRAQVAGSVNPGSDDFAVSDCYFEYGLTTDYGEKAACNPDPIGTGTSPVAVSASIGVLDPGKIYHYRLVAANGGGTQFGDDRTLTGGPAPADACPNAAIRAEQGALAQRLPNCGAYEMVSPSFTSGQRASASPGTADGNHAMVVSQGGFANTGSLPEVAAHYRTTRTETGWKSSPVAPPGSEFPYVPTSSALDWTRDGSRSLSWVNLKVDEGTERFTPVVRDPDDSFHVAGPTQIDRTNLPVATSGDLRTVVQRTTMRPALTDGTVDSRITVTGISTPIMSLYASTREPDGQLSIRQVAYKDGATMFPDCSVDLGGTNSNFPQSSQTKRGAFSQDGQKIFFTTTGNGGDCVAPDKARVWAKVGDQDPIDLAASQCPATCGPERTAHFRGAALDGSRVYFTTEQRLLPEDQDTSNQNDLYEYDFNATGQKLRLITGSTDPVGAGVPVFGRFRVSDDGAYVYFMATGRPLAGENARGLTPQLGDANMYVYHRAAGETNGTITFVAALEATHGVTFPLSSNGRHVLIETTADLIGERLPGDSHNDVYRYDAQEDELLRVWTDDPAHNGTARVDGLRASAGSDNDAALQRTQSAYGVSDDGSMVGFTSKEPLSPDDHNAEADAYLWEAASGRITLLTTGSSVRGNQFSQSGFQGMTPSGNSMFVTTHAPLLREHTSGQMAAYVIRRGGGFPGRTPPQMCSGDVCQGVPSPAPAAAVNGSQSFAGVGNVVASDRTRASLRVKRLRPVRGKIARLRVRVPGAGRIGVAGRLVRRTGRSVSKAGAYSVRISLSARARKALRKRGRVRVRTRVVFRARGGESASRTIKVTFKQPKAKRAHGKRKGDR